MKRKPNLSASVQFYPAGAVNTDDELFKAGFGSFIAQIVIEQERTRAHLRRIAKGKTMIECRRIAREALREAEQV